MANNMIANGLSGWAKQPFRQSPEGQSWRVDKKPEDKSLSDMSRKRATWLIDGLFSPLGAK
jgi:hypothetical protein